MNIEGCPLIAEFYAISVVFILAQGCRWFSSEVNRIWDKDKHLKNEAFSLQGSQLYNTNFWMVLIVGAGSVVIGGLISAFQDEVCQPVRVGFELLAAGGFNGAFLAVPDRMCNPLHQKWIIISFGVLLYVVVAAVCLIAGAQMKAKKLTVSEMYWGLQKGEVPLSEIGAEYRGMLVRSLYSSKNGTDERRMNKSKILAQGHKPAGNSTIMNFWLPGLALIVFGGIAALLEEDSKGTGYIPLFLTWSWCSFIALLSAVFGRRADFNMFHYYCTRVRTINRYRRYCVYRLGGKLKKQVGVVGAIVVDGENVLVARRSGQMSLPGMWEFPGGKVGPGETPEAVMARELFDELKCEWEIGERVETTVHEYETIIVFITTYYCTLLGDKSQMTEHSKFQWVSVRELPKLNWVPACIPAVKRIMPELLSSKQR